MAQFGRPSADTVNTDLYTDQAGGGTTIYTTIDEATLDDADYIRSPAAPSSDVYVTKLSSLEDPTASTGHILRVRYAKDAAGGAQINMTASLNKGYVSEAAQGTVIVTRTYTNVGNSFTTDAYTLSAAEADAVTDYTDLFLRIVSNQV